MGSSLLSNSSNSDSWSLWKWPDIKILRIGQLTIEACCQLMHVEQLQWFHNVNKLPYNCHEQECCEEWKLRVAVRWEYGMHGQHSTWKVHEHISCIKCHRLSFLTFSIKTWYSIKPCRLHTGTCLDLSSRFTRLQRRLPCIPKIWHGMIYSTAIAIVYRLWIRMRSR